MKQMHNPAHPGLVLREYLNGVSVTKSAKSLVVTGATLSRILNGNAGISDDMALRLEEALGTSVEMWKRTQAQHDL
jgi:antitoxin HigA-1